MAKADLCRFVSGTVSKKCCITIRWMKTKVSTVSFRILQRAPAVCGFPGAADPVSTDGIFE